MSGKKQKPMPRRMFAAHNGDGGSGQNSGSSSPTKQTDSIKEKLAKMLDEKRWGVDNFDEDIQNTGNSHCL